MTAAQQALLMVESIRDPSFSSVTLLAHFDGTNGSTTFTNSCPVNPSSATIAAGSPVIDTSVSEFGGASIHFPNSSGIKWHPTSGTPFAFGTGDFTIEFWVRIASTSVAVNFIDGRVSAADGNPVIDMTSGGNLNYFTNGANKITGASAIVANTWTAVALSRVSGVSRLYVGGSQVGSNFTDANNINTADLFQWVAFNGVAPANNGNVDELRVTNGVGRYAGSSYSLATAAFPNQ